jgi:hypothetical protein
LRFIEVSGSGSVARVLGSRATRSPLIVAVLSPMAGVVGVTAGSWKTGCLRYRRVPAFFRTVVLPALVV